MNITILRLTNPDDNLQRMHQLYTGEWLTFNGLLITLQGRQRKIAPLMRKVTPSGRWGMRQRRGGMRLPLRVPLMLYLLCYRVDRGRSFLWQGKSLHLGDEAKEEGHEATTEDTFNVVLIVLQGRQRKIVSMTRKVTPSGWWGQGGGTWGYHWGYL